MRKYKHKLSESDIDAIIKASENDMRLENMNPDDFDRDIARQILSDELNINQAIDLILEHAGVNI